MGWKISKDLDDLIDAITQVNPINFYRTVHWNTVQYKLFLSAHKIFTKATDFQ